MPRRVVLGLVALLVLGFACMLAAAEVALRLLDRPRERYRIRYLRTEPVGGRTTDVVELIPRSADMPFSKAIVWIDRDDALPRKLEISERRGGTLTITLSRIRTNDQVSEQAFAFTVPEGVRIIDQR